MVLRLRELLYLTLLAAALIALQPQAAIGASMSGSIGGNPSLPSPGVGGAAGPTTWFDLHNTGGAATDSILYNENQIEKIRENLGAGRHKVKDLLREAGRLFFNRCSGAVWESDLYPQTGHLKAHSTQCALWWNSKTTSNNVNWVNIHGFWPNKVGDPVLGGLAAYNFKVWRENRRANRLELIFARQLGVHGAATERNGEIYPTINRRWWYGGNTTKAAGENGRGGRFTNRGVLSAGPIGNYEGNDRGECIANWQRGNNGLRNKNGQVAGSNRVGQNVRPNKLPSGNFCYWEGDDIGPKAFRWSEHMPEELRKTRFKALEQASADAKNAQFGASSPTSRQGVLSAGLKEAIYIEWRIPTKGGVAPYFRWAIEGAPGLFYAVQVSGVDGREQLLPLRFATSNTGQFVAKRQLLSAVLVNPPGRSTCTVRKAQLRQMHSAWDKDDIEKQLIKDGYTKEADPDCFKDDPWCPYPGHPDCPETDPPEFVGSPPEVDVVLDPDSPAQTRQNTKQRIAINVSNYTDTQAVFPFLTNLIHYTPQQRFSSPLAAHNWSKDAPEGYRFGTYDSNYINYEDYPNGDNVPKQTSPLPPAPLPKTSAGGSGLPAAAEEVTLTRGVELKRDPATGTFSNGATSLTDVDYGMTWLQPTLSNPCQTDNYDPKTVQQNGWGWPSSPQNCPANPTVVNAWDDLLRAKVWWEERWAHGLRGNISDPYIIDRIYQENLRCADPVPAPNGNPDGGKRVEDCDNPSYGFFANVSNAARQNAQGYLKVVNHAERPGAAFIELKTNRPERVSAATVTPRDTGVGPFANVMMGGGPHGLLNTVTGNPTMSFCYMGLPGPDTKKFSGDAAKVKLPIQGQPDKVLDSPSGDADCRGYDARWYWPEPQDPGYAESCNAKPNKLPPQKPVNQTWPGVPLLPAGYNGYGGAYRIHDDRAHTQAAYDPHEFIGSPYVGRRPGGKADTGNYKLCEKPVPARYTKGGWKRTYAFRSVPGNATTCQYHYNELYNENGNLRQDFHAPTNWSPNGYGSKCASQWPNGSYRWRFGFYYPVEAEWVWNQDSWELGISNDVEGKKKTEIGPGQHKRDLGKWWDRPPTDQEIASRGWGSRGVTVINAGNRNHANEDIDKYFADHLWVKMVPKQGYLTSGQWVINRGPQKGWGANNSGFRLPTGGYIAEFSFTWPDENTARQELAYSAGGPTPYKYPRPGERCPIFAHNGLVPGTCWSMQADYDGFVNQQWRFAKGENDMWEDSEYITVFGPRSAR